MTRAQVIVIGGVPYLHITRPGAPAESRPMGQAELVRLMEEVARAVLVGRVDFFDQHGGGENRHGQAGDDPPPHYVGALGE